MGNKDIFDEWSALDPHVLETSSVVDKKCHSLQLYYRRAPLYVGPLLASIVPYTRIPFIKNV